MYEFLLKSKILSGKKSLRNLAFELKHYGAKRPLLLTSEMDERIGNLKVVLKSLDNHDIVIQRVYTRVPEIANVENVNKLIHIYKEKDCDSIIAIGSHNVINTARAIKLAVNQGANMIENIEEMLVRSDENVPLFYLPTNLDCATGLTDRAYISDLKDNKIYNIMSDKIWADVLFFDARLCDDLPVNRVAVLMCNAEALAIMAMISDVNPMAKGLAVSALNLIRQYYHYAIKKPKDAEVKLALMNLISFACGAYKNVELKLIHSMAIVLERICKIDYAEGVTILFPKYLNYIKEKATNVNEVLPYVVGIDVAINIPYEKRCDALIAHIKNMYDKMSELMKIKTRLSEYDVDRNDFSEIATAVICEADLENDVEFNFIMEILNKTY